MSTSIKVVEVFESIQGEVPLGKYALFIRLYGCNRKCRFCDTKYSWKSHTCFDLDVDSLHIPKSVNYVVFTGGEPLLQKHNLEGFIIQLKNRYPHIKIALETNGDITDFNTNLFDLIVISPKDMYTLEYWLKNITGQEYNNKVFLKVIDRPDDEQLFKYLSKLLKYNIISERCLEYLYIMPYGTNLTEINKNTKQILKRIEKYNLKGVNVAYRLHIALGIK